MHDPEHHIAFTQHVRDIEMVWMCAAVDDTIHVKIKVIELWQQSRVGNDLIDLGIPFTDPSVKLCSSTRFVDAVDGWSFTRQKEEEAIARTQRTMRTTVSFRVCVCVCVCVC